MSHQTGPRGKARTLDAITRHEAVLFAFQTRQLNQTGNERDNGRVIERETKTIARLRARLQDGPAPTTPIEPPAEHVRNAQQMLRSAQAHVGRLESSLGHLPELYELHADLDGAARRLALALAQLEPR